MTGQTRARRVLFYVIRGTLPDAWLEDVEVVFDKAGDATVSRDFGCVILQSHWLVFIVVDYE
jgi:hypothetical protein